MSHVDPDVLALLALGEEVASPKERAHLASCDVCRAEVENLARAATVGRTVLGAGDLLQPAPRVWSRIADELELDPDVAPAAEPATATDSAESGGNRAPRRP